MHEISAPMSNKHLIEVLLIEAIAYGRKEGDFTEAILKIGVLMALM